jgi:hypothetical protein
MMKNETITIAGERLADLEAAFDCLTISTLECGCLGLGGPIPHHLHQSLERALKTIEAEISEKDDHQDLDDEERDAVRVLLLRIGAVQTADDPDH